MQTDLISLLVVESIGMINGFIAGYMRVPKCVFVVSEKDER